MRVYCTECGKPLYVHECEDGVCEQCMPVVALEQDMGRERERERLDDEQLPALLRTQAE